MKRSRSRNTYYNIVSSISIRIFSLILLFASRTVFIYVLGATYLGLQGLFANILSFLALSELGIGSAISFLLYKPLAEDDIERTKAIMDFYRRCYIGIGSLIMLLGFCLMPFLHYLINLDEPIPENLYLLFSLFVASSAVSYFFAAYKQTLVAANQEKYKLTRYELFFALLNCVSDIVILIAFRDFTAYLISKLVIVVLKNVILSHVIDNIYPYLREPIVYHLRRDEIKKVIKDVYSVSVFRLGSVLFNSVSNIVTSAMIGTIVVGYYSNYMMIVMQIEAIFMLIVSSTSAGIGNLVATESKERQFEIYKKLDLLTFFVYGTCTICMFQLMNSFISIWIGHSDSSFILSQLVVMLICANFYANCSCQIIERFKTANGLFKIGRDLQVIGGIANIILSVLFAKVWGFEGVLASPFICKMLITVIPFVVRIGKYAFNKSIAYMLKEYLYHVCFVIIVCSIVYVICYDIHLKGIRYFFVEFLLTLSISVIGFILLLKNKADWKNMYFQYSKSLRFDTKE